MTAPRGKPWRHAGRRFSERLRTAREKWDQRRATDTAARPIRKTTTSQMSEERSIPAPLKVAAGFAWRIGVILLVAAGIFWSLAQVATVMIPVMVAALLAGLLMPLKRGLLALKLSNGLATSGALVLFIAALVALIWLVVSTMASGAERLWEQAITGVNAFRDWLAMGPLKISDNQVDDWLRNLVQKFQENSESLARQAANVGTTLTHLGTGLLLTVFALIFFLLEGQRIWQWVVRLFPRDARAAADGAGRRGWGSLVSYIRVQVVVALIDGAGIGAGALILNVPLAPQLAVLVFLGAFIPIVGALVTGAIAVLIALVASGWVVALIMLGVVLLVHLIESNVLHPLIMGKAVSLHPLAVVLVVACGTLLWGIPGALFSVPLLAIINSVTKYLAAREWEFDPAVLQDEVLDYGEAQDAKNIGVDHYDEEDGESVMDDAAQRVNPPRPDQEET